MYDVIIIGTGCAGFAAGIYSQRFLMKSLILGEFIGGTITKTHLVENYPGFSAISGMDLAKKLEEHSRAAGVEIMPQKVIKLEKSKLGFIVHTKKEKFIAKSIIYATGSEWKKLNAPGEKEFSNKGVSYCAACDGPLFRDATVAVVGGCDSAAMEALLLSEYAKKVYMIYRKAEIRPEPITKKRIAENKKIEIIPNTNILEFKGDNVLTEVVLDNPYNGSTTLKLDGVFIEIGHEPKSELAKQIGVKTNEKNEIIVDSLSKTNVEGFYAAGDVIAKPYKQAITAVAEGVNAAFSAYKYSKEKKFE